VTGRADHYASSTGTCGDCQRQKLVFRSRKAARRYARSAHPNEKLHAYECSPGRWHYGHDEAWRHETTLDADQVAVVTRVHVDPQPSALAAMHRLAHAAKRAMGEGA
jgi:hypothetical protein